MCIRDRGHLRSNKHRHKTIHIPRLARVSNYTRVRHMNKSTVNNINVTFYYSETSDMSSIGRIEECLCLKKNIKKKKKRKKEKRSTTLKHKKLINHVYFTTRHCHANSLPNPGHQHTTTESEHFNFFLPFNRWFVAWKRGLPRKFARCVSSY